MERKAERGQWKGGYTPPGYDKDPVASFYGNQHSLIRDAVEAAKKVYDSSHETVAAELKAVRSELSQVTGKIDRYLDAFEADTFDADDDNVKVRLLKHRTQQRQLREREADLLEELENEPTMPDAATLDDVQQHITEILRGGNHNQRKAIVRIVPVFRVPNPTQTTNAEGAETGLPVPAPEGVRTPWPLVDLVRAYSNRLDLASSLVTTLDRLRRAQQDAPDAPMSVRSTGRSERQWRVTDRLADADLRVLIAAAEAGTSKRTLAEQYGVSESSVKRIVRRHRKAQAASLSAVDQ